LATHFCNAYNESSADTDLGLPLLYKTTKKDFPARSSLKQTYEFILSDIAQAETLLQNKTGSVGATSFTIDAVKALKARVLLYKNEWQQAYNVAKALVDANTYSLVTTQSELEGVWHNDDTKESITQIFAGIINGKDQEVVSATNDIYLDEASDYFNPGSSIYSPQAVPTQDFVNLYNANDIRKKQFDEDLLPSNKFFSPDRVIGGQRKISTDYIYMRVDEFYLLAAEALAKLGQDTQAKTIYKKLLKLRYPEATAATDIAYVDALTNAQLQDDIYLNTRIELWGEGKSYFAMKRNHKTIERGSNHVEEKNTTFSYDNPRLTFAIPQNESINNLNL